MGAASEFDLLGLFQGIGLPFRSNDDIARLPNMIWLYRRPILDYWAEHEETLGHIVRHVLIHEIGHHFGLSDADMEAIEAQAGNSTSDQLQIWSLMDVAIGLKSPLCKFANQSPATLKIEPWTSSPRWKVSRHH